MAHFRSHVYDKATIHPSEMRGINECIGDYALTENSSD
jgi:hypothetical protein